MRKIGITMRIDVSGHGERRNSLDMQWPDLLYRLGFSPILLPNVKDNADKVMEDLELSALILSGGNDTIETGSTYDQVRQDFEMRLLAVAAEKKLPVVGVCRGMQMMNIFCQGKNELIAGHVAQNHTVHWKGEVVTVNSFHNFGITSTSLADDLEIDAVAQDGSIEAVRHKSLPWFGVMWHPERNIPNSEKHHLWLTDVLSGGKG